MKKKAVILLSGGLDSCTMLYWALKNGYECHCLIFKYHQRHSKEVLAAVKIACYAKVNYHILKISLPWKGSALLDKHLKILKRPAGTGIPSTYVPARNTIFLSYALSYAEAIHAKAIMIGAHTEDYSGYPDCRAEYFDAFRKMKDLGTKYGKGIDILTPLVYKSKAEIIKLAIKLGAPYKMTWSCYKGGRKPCGECESCYYRKKGFDEAGIKE